MGDLARGLDVAKSIQIYIVTCLVGHDYTMIMTTAPPLPSGKKKGGAIRYRPAQARDGSRHVVKYQINNIPTHLVPCQPGAYTCQPDTYIHKPTQHVPKPTRHVHKRIRHVHKPTHILLCVSCRPRLSRVQGNGSLIPPDLQGRSTA